MKIGCWEVPKPTDPSLLWLAEWKVPAPFRDTCTFHLTHSSHGRGFRSAVVRFWTLLLFSPLHHNWGEVWIHTKPPWKVSMWITWAGLSVSNVQWLHSIVGRQRRPDLFEGKLDSWQSRSSQLANKETNEAVACKLCKDISALCALGGIKLLHEGSRNNCKIQYHQFQIYSCDMNHIQKYGISMLAFQLYLIVVAR